MTHVSVCTNGRCHRSPDRRIDATGEIVLTEGVDLEPRDGFLEQTDTAPHRSGVRSDTEVARDDITDHNRRPVIDKVVDPAAFGPSSSHGRLAKNSPTPCLGTSLEWRVKWLFVV